MKTLKSDTAARHRLNSRSEAKQWFDTLPAKFQKSMVGGVYQKIIDHLGAEGAAPLDTILAELFPDREPAAARRSLANNFANRPYLNELGLAPLRLRLSPANETPATVWFESEASKSLQHETPDTPNHSAQTFAGGLAAQATGEEVKKAEIEKLGDVVKTAALRQGEIEAELNKPDQPRTYAGLRKGAETGLFTTTTSLR